METIQTTVERPVEWYDFEAACRVLGRKSRSTRSILGAVSPELTRPHLQDNGRPRLLYHYTALPELAADFREKIGPAPEPVQRIILGADEIEGPPAVAATVTRQIAAHELAEGQLRARAVREYHERKRLMIEMRAAEETVLDWKCRPRLTTVETVQRINQARGTERKFAKHVQVGGFSVSSLRVWARVFAQAEAATPGSGIAALSPARRGVVHKDKIKLPEELLNLVHAFAVSTQRADIVKAVAEARRHWPTQFPQVSIDTWRRRILERDPARASVTLGKEGIAAFEREHVPDIERDWSKLRYNQLWQIDDMTEDYYGHSTDHNRLVRPFAYAIARVATRQWVACVTTETPITQDQVRSLVGLAMASPGGGIPEEMTFERGTVAIDAYLRGLLETLGVKIHQTGMDSGSVHPRALPDRGTGHWQGKAIIERMVQGHHNEMWQAPGQTGGEERNTAHGNLETIKREALARAKAGVPLILWTPEEWRQKNIEAMKRQNARSHSALPELLDPETGTTRHMSPDEYATHLGNQGIRVLAEKLLPMFFRRGLIVSVGRNGISHQGGTYGRFDTDLQKLAGTQVTIYSLREASDLIYVQEIGRCIEIDHKIVVGENGETYERKRGIAKAIMSKHQAMIEEAIKTGNGAITQSTWVGLDPARQTRPREQAAPEALVIKAAEIAGAVEVSQAVQALENSRFEMPVEGPVNPPATAPALRRGLLSREADLAADLVTLGAL